MKIRMPKPLVPMLAVAALAAAGCEVAERNSSASVETPVELEVPDPAVGSYAASFDASGLDSVSVSYPENPFIRALDVGSASLVLVAYTSEGSVQQLAIGPGAGAVGAGVSAPGDSAASAGEAPARSRVDVDAWTAEAWLGRVRYHVSEGSFLVAERTSDEVASGARERAARPDDPAAGTRGITMPPQRAATGPSSAAPAQVPIPRTAGPSVLWKRDLGVPIAAGPIVFGNIVLVATSRPSWVGFNRASGEPVFERPLDRRLYGPLAYIAEPRILVALGTDGSLCAFSAVSSASPEDPVSRFLGPGAEARKRIEDRAEELVKAASPLDLPLPVYLAGGRPNLPAARASLHKFDCGATLSYRIYVEGAASVPVLVVLFSAEGEELLSNLEYSGVGSVIAKTLDQGSTYYVLVAPLTDDPDAAAALAKARLVIAPKK